MSSLDSVIEYYNKGIEAKTEKNFLRAARYFRMCYYHFQEGELPLFDEKVKQCGEDSTRQYYFCKSRLTDEAKRMLEKERKTMLNGNWQKFVQFTYNKILEEWNTPSPNRID